MVSIGEDEISADDDSRFQIPHEQRQRHEEKIRKMAGGLRTHLGAANQYLPAVVGQMPVE